MHLQQIKSTREVTDWKHYQTVVTPPHFHTRQNASVLQNLISFACVKNCLNSLLHEDCGDLFDSSSLGYFIHCRVQWLFSKCWWWIQRPQFWCCWQLSFGSRNVLNVQVWRINVRLCEGCFLFLFRCYLGCLHCWSLGWQDGTETGSPTHAMNLGIYMCVNVTLCILNSLDLPLLFDLISVNLTLSPH